MGRTRFRPILEEFSLFCNLCGAKKTDNVKPAPSLDEQLAIFSMTNEAKHWCNACMHSRGLMVLSLRNNFDPKVALIAFSRAIHNFCVTCGKDIVKSRRRCFCESCRPEIGYQYYDDLKQIQKEKSEANNQKKSNVAHSRVSSHNIGDGWYCNFCGRWVARFPRGNAARGVTKFWCQKCLDDPRKQKIAKDMDCDKWFHCIRCSGPIDTSDAAKFPWLRHFCVICRKQGHRTYSEV